MVPEASRTATLTHDPRARSATLLTGALCILGTLGFCAAAQAQEAPPVGMRPADVRRDALVDVLLVSEPGKRTPHATIVMKDGWIEAAGPMDAVAIPPGTTVHAGQGRTVYAGFIDACVRMESQAASRATAAEQGAHWNGRVVPQLRAQGLPALGADARKELRSLGFTTAALFPNAGVFRGSGMVALLGDEPRAARTIAADAGTAVAFEHAGDGDWDRATYPGALIGSIALVRQTLADAKWHAACAEVWRANPSGNQPPVLANALVALHDAAGRKQRVWFDASDERMLLRAAAVADEFELDAGFVGSGREYRRLPEVRALARPVVTTFDFPKSPDLSAPWAVENVPLRDLAHWALAPTNLAQLERAGVPASVSTARLAKRGEFAAAARRALEYGTTEDELLAALTVNPAGALGIAPIAGTVAPGKVANLVVCEGPLYGEESKIREVWIAGLRHEVEPASRFPMRGTYALGAPVVAAGGGGVGAPSSAGTGAGVLPTAIIVDADAKRVEFTLPAAKDALRGSKATFDDARGGFQIEGRALGMVGTLRGAIVATAEGGDLVLTAADGATLRWRVPSSARTGDAPKPKKKGTEGNESGNDGDGQDNNLAKDNDPGKDVQEGEERKSLADSETKTPDPAAVLATIPRTSPLGDFGSTERVAPAAVLVRDATVWTVSDAGIIEHCDLLAVDGKIVAVGKDLRASLAPGKIPSDALVIEAAGMHLTPGLIDCHSHTGIDGGVNEWTQNVTAEVRIADAVNPDDIDWYRELAGGLTAANQLHGSANPIGGQNSVVKLKWGHPARDFTIADAPAGIKFALGENVVRGKGRYPGSRLGVEALLRDRFQSAREYAQAHARYAALAVDVRARTMPPRRDLELEALAEVLAGTRLVHCHSYRQDEIAMLLRVAEDFGFRVGTLQHVLEGYKIAEQIAKHGAGASTFSDWWAYKMEVMDAIPWNGQMMSKAGVVTSFNSDSDELARRMNTEASKAMRWGGMPREEAIKMVTLNPAKQLRIAHRCGSLEAGKDADFVLWSADPLSVYARCMQTWIEGERYFDRATDAAMRTRDDATRRTILALASSEGAAQGKRGSGKKGDDKEDAKPGDDEGDKDAAPTDDGGGRAHAGARAMPLLSRMLDLRRAAAMELVRQGRDPASLPSGDCGCSDAGVWSSIFEMTGGEGGRR